MCVRLVVIWVRVMLVVSVSDVVVSVLLMLWWFGNVSMILVWFCGVDSMNWLFEMLRCIDSVVMLVLWFRL